MTAISAVSGCDRLRHRARAPFSEFRCKKQPFGRSAMKAPANLTEKLATFTDRFSPRTVATYNNNDIMVAKLYGPFHWHKHDETDDFFLVLKGTLDIELRDRTV